MHFIKMHGLGNDYVFVPCQNRRPTQPSELARRVSNRRWGIGSDGLILIFPSTIADAKMEMYNADGSRAQMCGNGLRCVARHLWQRPRMTGDPLAVETDCGIRHATLVERNDPSWTVCIGMGEPRFHPSHLPALFEGDAVIDAPMQVDGSEWTVTCVSMGNPHAIVFVDDVQAVDLFRLGPSIENLAIFPERINVHFVQIQSPTCMLVRTWERGSGATSACGTGACAAVVAAVISGRAARDAHVELPGGALEISWRSDGRVHMTGPATVVFEGEWKEPVEWSPLVAALADGNTSPHFPTPTVTIPTQWAHA